MLINCSYNPHKSEIKKHLTALRHSLDLHCSKYDKILILKDFNVGIEEANMQSFCEKYNLKSLIKQSTGYKNPDKPTCIDLILTNVLHMFQSTCVTETGMSDFHLMTVTVMRKTFKKLSPRIISYRSYKDFSNERFRDCLVNNLSNEIFSNNDNGLMKYARGNQMPFMTKDLSKEMMTTSRLRNKYLKDKTEENRLLYTQQRNKCVSLLRKTKINYYGNLNVKEITDNKKFWKTVKPFLSDKSKTSDKIHFNENGELLNSESETAEVLNNFFSNIVKDLKIPEYENLDRSFENVEDPVLRAILKYKNHPSITVIKEKAKNSVFSFYEVVQDKIEKEINRLNKVKASRKSDIPIKNIHDDVDIFADFIAESFKGAIKTSNFSNCLKLADITPLHKKWRKDNKKNYRPVRILPALSKIFERTLFEQISVFFDKFLSDQQCGFRKGYSTQPCLLNLLEKCKNCVDKGKAFGALLTDLPKAFHCLDHELRIAKLNAYGFNLTALRLIHDYLANRKQRTKIDDNYSSWSEILFGVLLGQKYYLTFRKDQFLVHFFSIFS